MSGCSSWVKMLTRVFAKEPPTRDQNGLSRNTRNPAAAERPRPLLAIDCTARGAPLLDKISGDLALLWVPWPTHWLVLNGLRASRALHLCSLPAATGL